MVGEGVSIARKFNFEKDASGVGGRRGILPEFNTPTFQLLLKVCVTPPPPLKKNLRMPLGKAYFLKKTEVSTVVTRYFEGKH